MKIQYMEKGALKAKIEENLGIGFYLYIYDEKGNCIADHLQDSLELAKIQAEEEYSIPQNSWTLQADIQNR